MPTISYNIPADRVAELKAAVDHHVGTDTTARWTNADYLTWVINRHRSDLRSLVFKYRESQLPAIDRTDPTEA